MTHVQNFIETPREAARFLPRLCQSLQTVVRFIFDQRWPSLIILLLYIGLMIWDYRSVKMMALPTAPEWTQDWPAALKPLQMQIALAGLGTWRAGLAGFILSLYMGNALLHMADNSAAFRERAVVGLVRYMFRGFIIALLCSVPLLLGLLLFVLPGLWMGSLLVAAATLSMFTELNVVRALGEGYRLLSRSLPGQPRILGFSRSFVHILGAYAVTMLGIVLFMALALILAALASQLLPTQALALHFVGSIGSNLGGALLNLSFPIFVLRLYSEYKTFVRS